MSRTSAPLFASNAIRPFKSRGLRSPGSTDKLLAASGPVYVTDEMTKPELVSYVEPEYSKEARAARIQGVVILQAVVDERGDVTVEKVLKGSLTRSDGSGRGSRPRVEVRTGHPERPTGCRVLQPDRQLSASVAVNLTDQGRRSNGPPQASKSHPGHRLYLCPLKTGAIGESRTDSTTCATSPVT